MLTRGLDVTHAPRLLRRQAFRRIEQQKLRKAQHAVQRRAQLVAHARQKLGFGSAGLLGGQLVAHHLLGQLALGDVPIHAQRTHRLASLVVHDHAAGVQPVHRAVGPHHPKLKVKVRRLSARKAPQRPLLHHGRVVRVNATAAQLVGRARVCGLQAAQRVHLRVPLRLVGDEIALPGAQPDSLIGQHGALLQQMQTPFGGAALRHVHMNAVGHLAAAAQLAVRATHHRAHRAVGAQHAKFGF